MGKFSKPKSSSVNAEEIRKQEEAKIKKENADALKKAEEGRASLRKRAFNDGEEDNITRKTLLGQ